MTSGEQWAEKPCEMDYIYSRTFCTILRTLGNKNNNVGHFEKS